MNLFDRIITSISPMQGLRRLQARTAVSAISGGTGYRSAGSRKRSLRGWFVKGQSADADTLPSLEDSRASSRDLYMNSPVATAALKRARTNVVGYGLTLQSRIDRELLDMNDEDADAWERATEREFRLWADSQLCDASRMLTFYDLQGLAFLSTVMSGDCFALLPMIPAPGMPYDLRVQLIEGDDVCNPKNNHDSEKIAGGIEVDSYGAPVRYHIRRSRYSGYGMDDLGATWTSVPAFGSRTGRRNVLHLMDRERPGQRRGMPLLAPVIEPLKQLSQLGEAELMAAVVSSFFTVFVKSQTGEIMPMSPIADGEAVTDAGSTADANLYEMGSGNIIGLADGESIEMADPKRPNDSFDPFFTAIVKQIGAAIEQPYEVLMLHFASSYSASRAALLEAWKFYRQRRIWLARYFCQPVYEEWLTEAIGAGRIEAQGFFTDPAIRKAWCGSYWGGPGQGQIDPLKETKAAIERINGNLSTHEDEYVAIHGGDWEGALNRRAREQKLIAVKGLTSMTNADNGTAQDSEDIEETDDEQGD